VELSDSDTSILCAFADEDGSGSVPGLLTAKLVPESLVRASVHRVREAARAEESQRSDALVLETMVLETMVRFDFELTSVLRVQ
jgi:hypothetical protein